MGATMADDCVACASSSTRRPTCVSTNRTPGEIGPGQVLVRMGVGGICGSDLHYFQPWWLRRRPASRSRSVLGHEVAGTVAAVAADVTSLKIGDRVAVNPSRPCSACPYCLDGLPNHCVDMRFYGSAMRTPHIHGAFRTVLLCEASQCVTIADGVPLSRGCAGRALLSGPARGVARRLAGRKDGPRQRLRTDRRAGGGGGAPAQPRGDRGHRCRRRTPGRGPGDSARA